MYTQCQNCIVLVCKMYMHGDIDCNSGAQQHTLTHPTCCCLVHFHGCCHGCGVKPYHNQAWEVKAGQLFRIVCIEGPQVADVNFWSLHNPKERFYASKTRQMHASHLKAHDRYQEVY